MFRVWGLGSRDFPSLRGGHFGGPHNTDYNTFGSILGPVGWETTILGNKAGVWGLGLRTLRIQGFLGCGFYKDLENRQKKKKQKSWPQTQNAKKAILLPVLGF